VEVDVDEDVAMTVEVLAELDKTEEFDVIKLVEFPISVFLAFFLFFSWEIARN